MIAWLVGCGVAPLGLGDTLGPSFRLSGPVSASAGVSGDHTAGAIAWAWSVDGVAAGFVEEVVFEPLVYRYAVEIPGPPSIDDGGDGVPSPLADTNVAVLVGLPLLIERDRATFPDVEVDAAGLLAWAAGEDVALDELVRPRAGHVAAGTTGHLVVLASEPAPWPANGPACRLDGVVSGLTLYRDEGLGCGGWAPLAPAGERTEFQEIPMAAWP